jgi:hypothetical protein
VSTRYDEFRVRKLLHLTHEEYLEEPLDTVDWTLKFAQVEAGAEAEKNKRG